MRRTQRRINFESFTIQLQFTNESRNKLQNKKKDHKKKSDNNN